MKQLSESRLFAESAYQSFLAMMKNFDKAHKLTDVDLVEEVETRIGTFKSASWEYAILSELIRRFEKAAKVERVDDYVEPTPEELAQMEKEEAEIEAAMDKPLYWVIQFGDGQFNAPIGYAAKLSDAVHYPTVKAANDAVSNMVNATVVEVLP